jgi:REP element-mobilizing transposase RayT
MDSLLDRVRSGPLYLRQPEIARAIVDALEYGDRSLRYYELHAYVVMANHVHILITPAVAISKITHTIKRFTARQTNQLLGLSGPFWDDENYDRLIRNDEFGPVVQYIENNPVRAGLVTVPEAFPWSSAGGRYNRPAGCNPAPLRS